MHPVKPRRRYDSSRRADQARQTRTSVLAAAQTLFLSDGFASTTIAAIAAEAGVSVETVYKAFGSKPGLVRAIYELSLAGSGPVPAETRSDAVQEFERDPREIIRAWGTLTAEVAPRVSPLLLLVRAAAVNDTEMAGLQAELDARRLARMTHNARNLAATGPLRPGITAKQAAEVMWTYSSPELYELLVIKLGWDLERYSRFVAEAMISALLPPEPRF
jgi:AcrR family transcriptional regulator